MLTIVGATRKWVNLSKTNEKLHHRSLFLFKKTNGFRKIIYVVSSSWLFEYFIFGAIIASCIITSHNSQNRFNLADPYFVADLSLNIVFALEAFIKIIAHGFILHRGAYLRNNWNVFDFSVVVCG